MRRKRIEKGRGEKGKKGRSRKEKEEGDKERKWSRTGWGGSEQWRAGSGDRRRNVEYSSPLATERANRMSLVRLPNSLSRDLTQFPTEYQARSHPSGSL